MYPGNKLYTDMAFLCVPVATTGRQMDGKYVTCSTARPYVLSKASRHVASCRRCAAVMSPVTVPRCTTVAYLACLPKAANLHTHIRLQDIPVMLVCPPQARTVELSRVFLQTSEVVCNGLHPLDVAVNLTHQHVRSVCSTAGPMHEQRRRMRHDISFNIEQGLMMCGIPALQSCCIFGSIW